MKQSILLIFGWILTLSIHAQDEVFHQFEIKGGILYDQDDQRYSFLERDFGDDYRLNYLGGNYLAIGYTRAKGKTKFGIEIDYFRYGNLTHNYSGISGPLFPPNRSKQQIQFGIFYGKSIIKNKKVDFYIAPISSITIRTNTLAGGWYVDIDTPIKDFVIGLGGKLQANFSITDKFSVSLGSKLMVLDYYSRNEANSIIKTNHFDFIRGDVVLQVGLVINI